MDYPTLPFDFVSALTVFGYQQRINQQGRYQNSEYSGSYFLTIQLAARMVKKQRID